MTQEHDAAQGEPMKEDDMGDEVMYDEDVQDGGEDGENEQKEMQEDGGGVPGENKNGDGGEGKDEEENRKDEDKEEAKEEKPREPETPKELEEDAATDPRPKVANGSVGINMSDTTVNVMPTCEGRMLMSLSEGGFQYLVAGARGDTGLKAGRYMFEAKIIEKRHPTDGPARGRDAGREPWPKQLVRLGFSTSGSSLLLNDGTDGFAFDSEGHFVHGKDSKLVSESRRRSESAAFDLGEAVAILLNLDEKSPNAYTVSLFKDGVRVCQPQPIPEHLKGKTLFPTVNYRNMTVHMNFGVQPFVPLPFACRMLQDAAKDDVEVAKIIQPKDGKYEVLFPVGLPDEGTFDWLDHFLQEHPDYTELSDRAIADWAAKSGVNHQSYRRGGNNSNNGSCNSNDKPSIDFGLPGMDDMSVRQVLAAVTPLIQRNFVVMEVRGNLLADKRKEMLTRFAHSGLKRIAHVVIGEPEPKFKEHVHSMLLKEKKEKLADDTRKNKSEEDRKRAEERKLKQIESDRKKQEKERKIAEKNAKHAEGKKDETQKEGVEEEKKVSDDEVDDEADQEEKEEDVEEQPDVSMEDTIEEALQKCELSPDEKQRFFRKLATPDIAAKELSAVFTQFALPEKDEGFDEVRFAWQSNAKCELYLQEWILEKKLMTRVEDLQPSPWFKEKWNEWYKLETDWRKLQQDWKDPMRRRMEQAKKEDARKEQLERVEKKRRDREWRKTERERKIDEREKRIQERKTKQEQALKAKEDKKKMDKIEAQEKESETAAKEDSEKKDPEENKSEEGNKVEEENKESKQDAQDEQREEKAVVEEEEEEEKEEEEEDEIPPEENDEDDEMDGDKEEEPNEVNAEELDVFNVEAVGDVGSGEPLCSNFSHEDWTLANLRFELHLLVHAFARDLNDPERPSFHESLLGFYYNKYFKKDFDESRFGAATVADFLATVRDTVELQKNGILEPMLSDDSPLDNFIRLTEDYRRERQQRIDSGDDSAVLKFARSDSHHGRSYHGGGRSGPQGRSYQGSNQHSRHGAPSGGRDSYESRGAPEQRQDRGGYGGGSGHGGGGGHGGSYSGAQGGGGGSRYSAPPPASRGGGGYGGGPPSYGGSGGGGGSYGANKRPYDRGPGGGGSSSYGGPDKGARTSYPSGGGGGSQRSSYGPSGGGYGAGGGGGGGYRGR